MRERVQMLERENEALLLKIDREKTEVEKAVGVNEKLVVAL